MNFLLRALAIALPCSCLHAGDVPVPDPDLPQPLDFRFAETLVTNSPFTRVVSLEDSFQLTGIAYVDGHPLATVLDRRTKQSFVVSEEPNARGWSLLAAHAGPDLDQTQVELRVGTETIAMHYQGQQPSEFVATSGKKSAPGKAGKTDGDKARASSFLGDHGREMYASLSPEARDKFKSLIDARIQKHPELTPEQTASYAQKVFEKIKAADSGGSKTPKAAKPPKNKQGA
ncbi:MAG: hypothetical protein JNG86_10420 [Verrucomicrobiaceae bacterium]|nr:hypothetical protein [Verrucomicrobiaceae bacterium]